MTDKLYSLRMRASLDGSHISGAERIVSHEDIGQVSSELVARAMSHERGRPDSVSVKVESLAGRPISMLPALPVTDNRYASHMDGRPEAIRLLTEAGVSSHPAGCALDLITSGASFSGRNMRGAMIIDTLTGERYETDSERGVRARAIDFHPESLAELSAALSAAGLDNTHLREALALATKVANAPGIVAELCISDDPSYVTGYVASRGLGYARITPMKRVGDPMGGRAFFVDGGSFNQEEFIDYLRNTPVLVTGPFSIGRPCLKTS